MRPSATEDVERPASRRERLCAELEREALAAARRLIVVQGVEALSLSAVAREIGLTPQALYRYFEGKPRLTLAVYEAVTSGFVATVAKGDGCDEPGGLQWSALRGHPGSAGLVGRESGRVRSPHGPPATRGWSPRDATSVYSV
ncbi:TetR/AcrR family transcriptional regulator [Streptomyces sp. NPDC056112]|uniref:TetR/AcrR family transcriptional regulator n=1 Tax=Streptomyces sp. NPDC056112 TaxID=3345715 RepID=UPI0035DE44BB